MNRKVLEWKDVDYIYLVSMETCVRLFVMMAMNLRLS